MESSQLRVAAVVVSFNRELLLKECLDGLSAQTYPLARTIVVDNASTDNSVDVIKNHFSKPQLVQLNENVGGAGGFAAGIAMAVHDCDIDYVWIMDDDTIPTPTALEKLVDAIDDCVKINDERPVIVGSKAIWVDGREHLMNKPRLRQWIQRGPKTLAHSAGSYQARTFSFVSCCIDAEEIRARKALPISAYFLWNDDFEYSTRLLKNRIGYYIPESIVEHRTKVFGSSNADPGARFRFEVRNKRWLFKYSRSNFTALERVYYLLGTAKRWVGTLIRSSNKKALISFARQGWKEAGAQPPASNDYILSATPDVAALIEQFESANGGASTERVVNAESVE
ncbi:glycosyltransferase [Alloscardovia theropitheci]|uniref:Glycosyltransferase n=1 Tax=Alloscardovia theropitheci TaxID=2496842 RepID=A0A4R0QPK9_9BIFI|nr:glycosyltransferase [Alloscardovia theropitheci]TCD54164.1 glycosyltransferase [Alloscardovia theropitheci]